MSKFYGGGTQAALTVCGVANREQGRVQFPPASTYHGPSREGVSGECAPPDAGSARQYASEQSAPDWRYFTEHDYAELAEGF